MSNRTKKQGNINAAGMGNVGGDESDKKGGLIFMALRFNIIDTRRELVIKKKITLSESSLLQEIELGTIGARNSKNQICSKAEFYLEDLSMLLGYKTTNKIWTLLKSLHTKKLIVRSKTRSKGREIIGLNPDVFGQILIDTQHEIEKKRHLKMVVDNSEKEHTECGSGAHESRVENTRTVCDRNTKRVLTEVEPIEITDEKSLLDLNRLILDSSRGKILDSNGKEIDLNQMDPKWQRIALKGVK